MGKRTSLGLLLLAAQQSFAQTNSSAVPSVTSLAPTSTGTPPCCFYQPHFVGLNVWFNSSITATVATVITSVLQYNDTVITTSTTLQNSAPLANMSVPSSLLGNGIYTSTMIDTVTEVTTGWGDQVMASPTPFVEISLILYIPGEMATESGVATCGPGLVSGDPALHWDIMGTPFVFAPSPTTQWSVGGSVEVPTAIISAWISQTPDITTKYPDLTTCSPIQGSGEPSIHVPVSGLTEHSTTTVSMDGGSGGDQPDPTGDPEPTSEPEPTSNPPLSTTPEPVVTPDPTTSNPEPTSEPEPEPQPTENPPQSTGGNNTPPQSSGGNNTPPQSSGGNNTPPQSSGGNNTPPQSSGGGNTPPQPSGGDSNPPPAGTTGAGNPPAPQPTGGDSPSPPVVVVPAPSGPGVVLPGDTTLTPGQTTTISGVEIGVPTNVATPTVIVVDGTTVPVQQGTPVVTQAPVSSIVIGSETIAITPVTESGSSGFVLPNGDTLLPGSTTTINGETIVLSTGPSSTNVQVIDSSTTETIPLYTPTTSTSTGGPAEYTGAASPKKLEDWTWLAAAGVFALL